MYSVRAERVCDEDLATQTSEGRDVICDTAERIYFVDMWRTNESSVCLIKVQIWQLLLSHSVALRLAKSDGTLAIPDRC